MGNYLPGTEQWLFLRTMRALHLQHALTSTLPYLLKASHLTSSYAGWRQLETLENVWMLKHDVINTHKKTNARRAAIIEKIRDR